MKIINLSGKKINNITVVNRSNNKGKHVMWNCVCDCGAILEISTTHLRNDPIVKSCGCLNGEQHKQSKHELYNIWTMMRERCNNIKSHSYKNYGGRGINVCKEWDRFSVFLNDMGERPTKEHTIERINNNSNYCLENCKWATKSEQALNRRLKRENKRSTNTSGITGVCWDKKRNSWHIIFRGKFVKRTKDLFEACCIRKSYEQRFNKKIGRTIYGTFAGL